MRAVLQRVTGATVHVEGKLISRIGPGIVALIGIGTEDTAEEIIPISQKILTTKLWNEGQKASQIQIPPQYSIHDQSSSNGVKDSSTDTITQPLENEEQKTRSEQVWGGKPWKQNVMDLEGEVMCISQFTLHARLSKGTKPDFHKSMGGEQAKVLYDQLLERLGKGYRADRIKDGAFGEMMQCSLTNDGPVTILIDTADNKKNKVGIYLDGRRGRAGFEKRTKRQSNLKNLSLRLLFTCNFHNQKTFNDAWKFRGKF